MNSISAVILFFLMSVVFLAPRKWAILGMAAGALYLTEYSSINVIGFNMFSARFLEIVGFIRIVARREYTFTHLIDIDRIFLAFYSYTTIVFLLRSNESQAYMIGMFVDATLCYFIFRGLIANIEEFRWFLRAFVILLAPYVLLLCMERLTEYNLFSTLSGTFIAEGYRAGKVRCTGSFRHPSLLGTLGGSFLPIYIGFGLGVKDRNWGIIGIILCLAIVFFSNSGGPLTAAAIGVAGWLLWPVRLKMYVVRRSILGLLIIVSMFMNAPIWYLAAKFSDITGGSGWHRAHLMEMASNTFGKWWLAGMPIKETAHWFPYGGELGTDITNQYVSFGLSAGILATILFTSLLVKCYKKVGRAMKAIHTGFSKTTEISLLLWGLGVMLTVHVENWFGITYFDQTSLLWFLQLAAIVNISQMCRHPRLSNVRKVARASMQPHALSSAT